MPLDLTPERALLFRITHISNLPWLLANGLHASEGGLTDPNFTSIGNPDLIGKRSHRTVPIQPGGVLAEYIPFYFTPRSPMLYNITTGHGGIARRSNDEIAILVTSCRTLTEHGVTTLYTDRHAYSATAAWRRDPADLATLIDWDILCRSDFRRDDDRPDKMERYQAEALAHRHVPPAALKGIECASETANAAIDEALRVARLTLRVVNRPRWYFW